MYYRHFCVLILWQLLALLYLLHVLKYYTTIRKYIILISEYKNDSLFSKRQDDIYEAKESKN